MPMPVWYVIDDVLDRRDQLVKARVVFSELDVKSPHTIKGLAFPEEEMKKVFEILGLTGRRFEEVKTERENVVFLSPKDGYKVVLESEDNMEAWDCLRPVLQEFALKLELDIYVSNPHEQASHIRSEDGKLYIRFWSTPITTKKTTIPEIFGMRFANNGQRDALIPTGFGVPIVDSNGVTAAEIHGGTLYVLFDLPHSRRSDETTSSVMQSIMECYTALKKDHEKYERLVTELNECDLKRSQEEYIKGCGRRVELRIDKLEDKIESIREKIIEAQQIVTASVREEITLVRELQNLQGSIEEDNRWFANEFEKILALPGVERITVRDDCIYIFTKQIDIEYRGDTYDIGKFRIDIHTGGDKGGVRCYNMTRMIRNTHHPHIRHDGLCCLGNIHEGVAKLIGEYEYFILIQVMLKYLETVTPGDWYSDIGYWPVKE